MIVQKIMIVQKNIHAQKIEKHQTSCAHLCTRKANKTNIVVFAEKINFFREIPLPWLV